MTTPLPEGHGLVGSREIQPRENPFSRLLPKRMQRYDNAALRRLAEQMIVADDELNDGADAEENLFVPAGYTYFGQFIDHDLTFDTTSNLDDQASKPTNLRTAALDLDCVYGSGPADQPYMYAADKAHLLPDDRNAKDLLRIPSNNPDYGRAVIGDKRNDENSIVCQIQLAFIKFHNTVVDKLQAQGVAAGDLFERARAEVRWTYQRIVLEDFLPRIVNTLSYDFFMQRRAEQGDDAYTLYTPDKWHALPIEFAAAAYRFGHSMVRTGYRLNTQTKKFVFDIKEGSELSKDSLVGFQPLPLAHVIDNWRRFFPDDGLPPGAKKPNNDDPTEENNPAVRMQWAYKIDTSLVLPLKTLPASVGGGQAPDQLNALASLNLRRGDLPEFALQDGQTFAHVLGEKPLDAKYLVTRADGAAEGMSTFKSIGAVDASFLQSTPLWFYILAEAQVGIVDAWIEGGKQDLDEDFFLSGPGSATQLGPVGGRILLEVFNGLVDADPRSFRRAGVAAGWQPMIGSKLTFFHLLKFAGLAS
jgi:Animal haem peroxidase